MASKAPSPPEAEAPGAVESAPPPEEPKRPELPLFDSLGPNAPSFEDWFERNIAYIREVQAILSHPMDDSPGIMDSQAREAEGHAARMASMLAWADSYLDVAEHVQLRKMPSRDPQYWTDLDRTKALAAAVTRERRFRDVVKGLCESIQQRISYAQSRLRAFSNAETQRLNG